MPVSDDHKSTKPKFKPVPDQGSNLSVSRAAEAERQQLDAPAERNSIEFSSLRQNASVFFSLWKSAGKPGQAGRYLSQTFRRNRLRGVGGVQMDQASKHFDQKLTKTCQNFMNFQDLDEI